MRKLDPVELEHVEQVARSAGYAHILTFLQDEAAQVAAKIMLPGVSHEQTQYLRGYHHGLCYAKEAARMILKAGRKNKGPGR